MKSSVRIWLAVLCLVLGSGAAQAQWFYQFSFHGTCYQTNGSGVIRSIPVNDKTLLRDIALAVNITNTSWMAMVYHVGGNELGDTIEIINATNGVVLDTFMGLYFGQAFARVGLTNSAGTEEKRIDYIYTKQDGHSMGAAFITKRYSGPDKSKRAISGSVNWVVRPENGQGTKMYSGSFTASKALSFGQP